MLYPDRPVAAIGSYWKWPLWNWLCAPAARQSWRREGAQVFLSDLGLGEAGYDGAIFARGYRHQKYPEGG